MNIVILTGAGISAESGLGTFRDKDGIWTRYRIEDVATPEASARNPALVHEFYNLRRQSLRAAVPNTGHLALAELERRQNGGFLLVTKNVDDLHQRAGSQNVLAMHGELQNARCDGCGYVWPAPDLMFPEDRCARCGSSNQSKYSLSASRACADLAPRSASLSLLSGVIPNKSNEE